MLARKHKGGRSELLAICKLWDMGYEVFRNQSQCGPIDLIAVNSDTGECRKFDVKSASEFKRKSGLVMVQTIKLNEKQLRLGVELIMVTARGNVHVGVKNGERFSDN